MSKQESNILNPETPAGQTDAEGKTIRPLAKLFPYLKRYKLQVSLALFFLLLASATTLTLPLAVRRVIDHGFTGADPDLINSYFAMLVLIAAVLAVASAGRYYFVIWLGERVVADLRKDVFANLTRLGAEFFDSAKTGEIVSRLTADTTQIKSAVGATASLALRNTLLGLGSVTMMVFTSPRLSLLVIGAIPLIVLPIIAFGRAVRKRSRRAQDTLAEASAYAAESVSAVRTMQAYSTENFVRRRFFEAVDYAFNAARASIKTRAFLTAFAIFLIFSSIVAVLWIGANDVLQGTLSPGTLSQFLLYAVFAAGALGSLSEVWGELSQAAGSAERLVELLLRKPKMTAPGNPSSLPDDFKGGIVFDKVSFSYPTRQDSKTLDQVSFRIQPGETVALVGPSGAGKSTIFSLLLRFYDPNTGNIALGGINLRDLDPVEFRKKMALVPQESFIFADTAAANIAYGYPDASKEQVLAAANAAHADEFINSMPEKFDTLLGERGITLSGGQRQRIAIARAILRNAPVLLLDEATSSLDAESEKLIQDALETLVENRTTLIIAHRLSTVLKADRILVLDQGRIVEEGTHAGLVKKNGLYAGLAKLQFTTPA